MPTIPIAAVRWAIRSSKVVSGERTLLKRLCRLATWFAGTSIGGAPQFLQTLPRRRLRCRGGFAAAAVRFAEASLAMPPGGRGGFAAAAVRFGINAGNVLPGLGACAGARHDGGLGLRDGCGNRAPADASRGAPRSEDRRRRRQARPPARPRRPADPAHR